MIADAIKLYVYSLKKHNEPVPVDLVTKANITTI